MELNKKLLKTQKIAEKKYWKKYWKLLENDVN